MESATMYPTFSMKRLLFLPLLKYPASQNTFPSSANDYIIANACEVINGIHEQRTDSLRIDYIRISMFLYLPYRVVMEYNYTKFQRKGFFK